jgi:type II secretory pathway pseudopilin PulG
VLATLRLRCFTLLEVLVALIMLGLLYAVSASVYNVAYANGQEHVVEEAIQIALADGLRVASLAGNHYTIPSGAVSQLILPSGYSIGSGAASGSVLSGYVTVGGAPGAAVLLVAGYINGTCVVGEVTTSGTMGYATTPVDSSACIAAAFSTLTASITGTKANPAAISLP